VYFKGMSSAWGNIMTPTHAAALKPFSTWLSNTTSHRKSKAGKSPAMGVTRGAETWMLQAQHGCDRALREQASYLTEKERDGMLLKIRQGENHEQLLSRTRRPWRWTFCLSYLDQDNARGQETMDTTGNVVFMYIQVSIQIS